MIIDHIENSSLYFPLSERIATALRALQTGDLLRAGPGRHEIQGSQVFALVQKYDTKRRELGAWEAHRRYIDVHYIVSGTEVIGHSQLPGMTITKPYSEKEDILFAEGDGSFLNVSAGLFVIFFPHDAHMPSLAAGKSGPVHKIIVKVQVD